MIRRIASCAAVVLAVLVVPALCLGGILLHPCACCHESGCEHDSACANDPCANWMVRNDESAPEFVSLGPTVVQPADEALPDDAGGGAGSFRPEALAPRFRCNLPFPFSDVPLLI